MVQTILYIITFIMGTYFGSFYTLAVYRIPLGIDITHKHSFCPNCNHKLEILDLFPILSYIFLGGKCRYCKKKISSRYFMLEMISGLAFLMFTLSLNINIYNLEVEKLILLGFTYLYFAGMFIIAGIDKEKLNIQKQVLMYSIIISAIYIAYLYIVQKININIYLIYLLVIILLIILDTLKLRKKAQESYCINVLILAICMEIYTGEQVFLLTIIYTLLTCSMYLLLKKIKQKTKNKKYIKQENKQNIKLPIGFFMCICNVILYIFINFVINYTL